MAGADRVPLVSLISTTVAPGITPPCASFTVPVTVPVVICASAEDEVMTSASIRPVPATSILRNMSPPRVNDRRAHADPLLPRKCNRLHGAKRREGRGSESSKKDVNRDQCGPLSKELFRGH